MACLKLRAVLRAVNFFICPYQVLALLRCGWHGSMAHSGGGSRSGGSTCAPEVRRSVKNDELKALEDGQGITFTRKKRFNNGEKCNALQQGLHSLTHTNCSILGKFEDE